MDVRQGVPPTDAVRKADGGAEPAGRTTVPERVLRRVTEAASAEAIGVGIGDVSARLGNYRGALALRISSPFPVPDLDDEAAVAAAVPVAQRAAELQVELRDRLETLLGRRIGRVEIRVDGAKVDTRRRVR